MSGRCGGGDPSGGGEKKTSWEGVERKAEKGERMKSSL